jgi:fructokinase
MPENNMKKTIVGLGEVLWDILPQHTQLGGAPANFAYITSLLGDDGVVASRVGEDALGRDALDQMSKLELPVNAVQIDNTHPTGTARATINSRGEASFEITEGAAWDFLEWTTEWQLLAEHADAVSFGSLAQRSPRSQSTIRRFLAASKPDAVRIFDVNLRQSFYSPEIISESMKLADIVKVNHEELPRIIEMCQLEYVDASSSARHLIESYAVKLVCITRGNGGSMLVTKTSTDDHSGFHVKVADTIGAGDAFSAGLVHHYLRGAALEVMNDEANRVGAWVASQVGATPVPKNGILRESLAEIR